jgi:hypothetical protein
VRKFRISDLIDAPPHGRRFTISQQLIDERPRQSAAAICSRDSYGNLCLSHALRAGHMHALSTCEKDPRLHYSFQGVFFIVHTGMMHVWALPVSQSLFLGQLLLLLIRRTHYHATMSLPLRRSRAQNLHDPRSVVCGCPAEEYQQCRWPVAGDAGKGGRKRPARIRKPVADALGVSSCSKRSSIHVSSRPRQHDGYAQLLDLFTHCITMNTQYPCPADDRQVCSATCSTPRQYE